MAGKALIQQGQDRRVAILSYIRSYSREQGMAPSITEIADAVGLASPNATRNHLAKLAADGYVRLYAGRARGIALVEPGPDGWTRTAA